MDNSMVSITRITGYIGWQSAYAFDHCIEEDI